ncbi:uroporphyrin-III methyltransferase [Thioclava dalianensis]|uniref:Uroporphyrin-III methyltransferase n=1 Tax=Thioclava dalianensis TaxID=1185766 RepID=A0A074U8R2_9RHOB|nr:siroheme synthase CysG [Thioclava dalianensis]KEP71072.1 uroporphyrin-III methyltransferase [Thioclava dalianensis]SFN25421.1 uroporphyrin-III C-methyltransferase / precorrin-2 dehydrogenase / sirohydrochlorin ferrochelatase [Thioclava dalianensis]
MRHFPIFLDTVDKTIVVAGAGECAVAKLRLLLKTEARIVVFDADAEDQVRDWAAQGRVELHLRDLVLADLGGAILVYAAYDDPERDLGVQALAREARVPALVVDNLDASDFITPAIVDRDPVTVAIGTEGTAPVLARAIKAGIEARLPVGLGALARRAKALRPAAEALPKGRARRDFWTRFFFGGEDAEVLLEQAKSQEAQPGHVHFVGAGPGDPELLTLRARKMLHEADVVVYDRLVSPEILELARREARLIEVGKTGFGPSWKQEDINVLLVEEGRNNRVVRLKSGDPGVFGRLDEEVEALDAAGVAYDVTPGITAASAAVAGLGLSFTRRGRNSGLRIITGHDTKGFAEQDWRELARPGAVAAIYMGKKAARFVTGRLMMHGAAPDTPVSIVENASRADQRIIASDLVTLERSLSDVAGPAVLLLGLAPRAAAQQANQWQEAL